MYRAGTELTIVASGSAESFWTSLDFWNGISSPQLQSDVTGRLLTVGIDVYSMTIADRGFTDAATWQYRATLKCASSSDHARADDVAAVVRNAFYEATGYLPQVSVTSEGQPAPDALQPSANPFEGFGSGFKGTIDNLIDNLGIIGAVGVGLAVVVVGALIWSKAES